MSFSFGPFEGGVGSDTLLLVEVVGAFLFTDNPKKMLTYHQSKLIQYKSNV